MSGSKRLQLTQTICETSPPGGSGHADCRPCILTRPRPITWQYARRLSAGSAASIMSPRDSLAAVAAIGASNGTDLMMSSPASGFDSGFSKSRDSSHQSRRRLQLPGCGAALGRKHHACASFFNELIDDTKDSGILTELTYRMGNS